MRKREAKQYTAEEKAKIAVEGLKGELTIAQISSKYGVHATQITKWKNQLTVERDWLKKSLHSFSIEERRKMIDKNEKELSIP